MDLCFYNIHLRTFVIVLYCLLQTDAIDIIRESNTKVENNEHSTSVPEYLVLPNFNTTNPNTVNDSDVGELARIIKNILNGKKDDYNTNKIVHDNFRVSIHKHRNGNRSNDATWNNGTRNTPWPNYMQYNHHGSKNRATSNSKHITYSHHRLGNKNAAKYEDSRIIYIPYYAGNYQDNEDVGLETKHTQESTKFRPIQSGVTVTEYSKEIGNQAGNTENDEDVGKMFSMYGNFNRDNGSNDNEGKKNENVLRNMYNNYYNVDQVYGAGDSNQSSKTDGQVVEESSDSNTNELNSSKDRTSDSVSHAEHIYTENYYGSQEYTNTSSVTDINRNVKVISKISDKEKQEMILKNKTVKDNDNKNILKESSNEGDVGLKISSLDNKDVLNGSKTNIVSTTPSIDDSYLMNLESKVCEENDRNVDSFWILLKQYIYDNQGKNKDLTKMEKLFTLLNIFTKLNDAFKVGVQIDRMIDGIVEILKHRNYNVNVECDKTNTDYVPGHPTKSKDKDDIYSHNFTDSDETKAPFKSNPKTSTLDVTYVMGSDKKLSDINKSIEKTNPIDNDLRSDINLSATSIENDIVPVPQIHTLPPIKSDRDDKIIKAPLSPSEVDDHLDLSSQIHTSPKVDDYLYTYTDADNSKAEYDKVTESIMAPNNVMDYTERTKVTTAVNEAIDIIPNTVKSEKVNNDIINPNNVHTNVISKEDTSGLKRIDENPMIINIPANTRESISKTSDGNTYNTDVQNIEITLNHDSKESPSLSDLVPDFTLRPDFIKTRSRQPKADEDVSNETVTKINEQPKDDIKEPKQKLRNGLVTDNNKIVSDKEKKYEGQLSNFNTDEQADSNKQIFNDTNNDEEQGDKNINNNYIFINNVELPSENQNEKPTKQKPDTKTHVTVSELKPITIYPEPTKQEDVNPNINDSKPIQTGPDSELNLDELVVTPETLSLIPDTAVLKETTKNEKDNFHKFENDKNPKIVDDINKDILFYQDQYKKPMENEPESYNNPENLIFQSYPQTDIPQLIVLKSETTKPKEEVTPYASKDIPPRNQPDVHLENLKVTETSITDNEPQYITGDDTIVNKTLKPLVTEDTINVNSNKYTDSSNLPLDFNEQSSKTGNIMKETKTDLESDSKFVPDNELLNFLLVKNRIKPKPIKLPTNVQSTVENLPVEKMHHNAHLINLPYGDNRHYFPINSPSKDQVTYVQMILNKSKASGNYDINKYLQSIYRSPNSISEKYILLNLIEGLKQDDDYNHNDISITNQLLNYLLNIKQSRLRSKPDMQTLYDPYKTNPYYFNAGVFKPYSSYSIMSEPNSHFMLNHKFNQENPADEIDEMPKIKAVQINPVTDDRIHNKGELKEPGKQLVNIFQLLKDHLKDKGIEDAAIDEIVDKVNEDLPEVEKEDCPNTQYNQLVNKIHEAVDSALNKHRE